MFIRTFLFLLFAILFNACKQDTPASQVAIPLSFDIGDVKRFEIPDTIYSYGFIFSPVDSNGKIWTQTHELDLRTGEWTSLSRKFGVSFPVEVVEERMWIDPFSSNIYIDCSFGNVIEYDRQSKTFKSFKLEGFSSFFAMKEFVIFGASEGLYKYVRCSAQPTRIKALPANTRVEDIYVSYGDTLRLRVRTENTDDSHFVEHYLLNAYLGQTERKRASPTVYDLHIDELLPYFGSFEVVKDKSTLWFYGPGSLYVKKGKEVFQFAGMDSNYLRQLRVDSLYAYLRFDRRFVVMKKAYVDDNLQSFNVKSYQDQLQALIDFTSNDEPLSLNETMFKVDSVQKIYLQSEHPRVVAYAKSLNNLIGTVGLSPLAKSELERAIAKKELPEKYLKPALNNLFTEYGYRDELEKALNCVELFDEFFPNDQLQSRWMVSCLSKAKTSRDSIQRLPIPPDHKLFLVSLQREDLNRCAFAEVHTYDTIVSNSYKELLALFPKSEFADNAAFYLLKREHRPGGESYEVAPDGIREVEQFIQKYNHSELKNDAILLNARMYHYSSVEGAERVEALKKARSLLDQLSEPEFIKAHQADLQSLKSSIDHELKTGVRRD